MAIWNGYYTEFKIEPNSVREGCEPIMMIQSEDNPTDKAIVLIHGLTDSPFFMKAIGECFHQWGYSVYIPLLDGHGLKDPKKLKDVTLEKWLKNVDFAIEQAREKCTSISIGGLSTGGTISVLKMLDSPNNITGGIFLFSAALDIAGIAGNIAEKLLRTRIILPILADTEDNVGKKLIGDNIYRYSRMDKDGAKELSRLIYQTDKHLQKIKKRDISHPIFVAHSEYDSAADIEGVEQLIAKSDPSKTEFFRLGKYFHIPHASVVLKEDVVSKNGSPLEPKNPFFNEMMNAVDRFQKQNIINTECSLVD
jgi:esterase/lipase